MLPRNGIYKSKEFQGRGCFLVKMNQIFGKNILKRINNSFEKIDLSDSEKGKLLLEKGDLLFARTSVVADGIGKCLLIDFNPCKQLTFDSNIVRIRLDKKRVCFEYYLYYFSSLEGRDKVRAISSGSAVTTITGVNLSKLYVPFPPLSTQQKIAGILSAYDDLIENNTRRIEILEEMAALRFSVWKVMLGIEASQ